MTIRLDNKRSKERKGKERSENYLWLSKKRIKPENETLRRNGDYVMLVSNDKRRF